MDVESAWNFIEQGGLVGFMLLAVGYFVYENKGLRTELREMRSELLESRIDYAKLGESTRSTLQQLVDRLSR